MVESSALEAACAQFSCMPGQSNRRWVFFCSQLQPAFSEGSAQDTLGALFLYSAAVSQWAQCFLDLFPHFSGVPLFLLLIKMPGYYHCPLSYYFLLHTVPVCAFFRSIPGFYLRSILGLYYI